MSLAPRSPDARPGFWVHCLSCHCHLYLQSRRHLTQRLSHWRAFEAPVRKGRDVPSPCHPACWPPWGGRPRAGGLRRRVGAAKGHCVSQAPSQGELRGDRVCYSASRPPCQQAGSAEDSGRCRLPPRNIKQARAARPALPVPPAATPARGGGWAQWLRLTQDHVRVALGPHAWARVASPCMVSACGI